MNPVFVLALSLLMGLSSMAALAQPHVHADHASPYAGLERREVKSLSEADLEELRRGGGWGLALAAELNGVPGPAHLLDLKDEIRLSADQVAEIAAIFKEMQAEAITVGKRLIAAEKAIGSAFRSGDLSHDRLRDLIAKAEAARAELRYIHLSRHLSVAPMLTEEQIRRYNTLRGYDPDPCAHVPEGHDASMWRRHNGCD